MLLNYTLNSKDIIHYPLQMVFGALAFGVVEPNKKQEHMPNMCVCGVCTITK